MNELPNEVMLKIFHLVDPIEQIVVCRLVCKRWCLVIDNLKLKILVMSNCSNLPNNKWWYTYAYVNCRHQIKNSQNLDSIIKKLSHPLFSNLRSLYIYSIFDKTLLTDFLNRFQKLEQLEVIYSQLKNNKKCVLNLNNLKILNLGDAINDFIILNTPKLENIRINLSHINKVIFNYPKSIKFAEFFRYNDQIPKFSNLEYLYVRNINVLDDDFLCRLEKLKEIHFDSKKEIFYTLRNQKKLFKRCGLKIFYFGVNFHNESIPTYELKNSRHQLNQKAIKLLGDHYNQLATILPFVHQIDYCDLEDYFDDKIPRCLIKKFVNLDYLIVTQKIKHPDQLIQVLYDCSKIKSLAIDSSLDQQFYNNLPLIIPYIEYLIIKNEQKIEFDEFILQFENLQLINIRHELSIELVEKIFRKYNKLIFTFINEAKNVTIRIFNNDHYRLKITDQRNIDFENLDNLFNHIKHITNS